jgi:hypothetical protein
MSEHPYQRLRYAEAFGPRFTPLYLPSAQTPVLLRPIQDHNAIDAMGLYPLCAMAPAADLAADMELLRAKGAVSLVLVADSFFSPPSTVMQQFFDHHLPFKEHYVCDLRKDDFTYSKHHRYEVRKSHKQCETRVLSLSDHLDAWYTLYAHLISKHGMTGIQAFSKDYFAKIAALEPIMIGAFHESELISAHLWFTHEHYAYSHLAASSEKGYELQAAYAVYDSSITHLKSLGIEVIDLGGGAGTNASAGLSFLKKGFSNDQTMCYVYGKVLDQKMYATLSAKHAPTTFFPAYRSV